MYATSPGYQAHRCMVQTNYLPEFANLDDVDGSLFKITWNTDKTQAQVLGGSVASSRYLYNDYLPAGLEYNKPYLIHFSATDTNARLFVGDTRYTNDVVVTIREGERFVLALWINSNANTTVNIDMVDPSVIPGSVNGVYDIKIEQGENTYGLESLMSCKIKQSLFSGSGPEIGNTVFARCDLTFSGISSEDWPRMADFDISVRIVNTEEQYASEWIPMGTFYTDERPSDDQDYLTIVAYDGMMMLEQTWADKVQTLPTTWPITASAAGALLVEATGIQLDSSTVLDDTEAFFGLNTASTARDAWSLIACASGCNCVITRDKKIKLIPLDDGYTDGEPDVSVVDLGRNVQSLETSPALDEVTGVELSTTLGTKIMRGDETGYVLHGTCDFADDSAVDLCLANTEGFVYRPFNAVGGYSLDPAVDLGDVVTICGVNYQIDVIEWELNKVITSDFSAPYETEVNHEYQVESSTTKAIRSALAGEEQMVDRKIVEATSIFQQSIDGIQASVSQVSESVDGLSERYTEISETVDGVDITVGRIDEDLDELRMHYRFDETGETIGRVESEKSIKISNEEIDLNVNEEPVVVVNTDEMIAPRKVRIPYGGSMQVGNVIWQPRSSGNLSMLWVGD